jgi:hypothetical protein
MLSLILGLWRNYAIKISYGGAFCPQDSSVNQRMVETVVLISDHSEVVLCGCVESCKIFTQIMA